ncbi:MAG: DegT/DnrJ/EryC1/StrS family aminotransferase [bacterium]
MQIPFFELKHQYRSIQNEIDHAVSTVLKSGWYILGEELNSFEQEFASYCHSRYAIGVGSGTDAIQLALIACGIKQGDEVITVPNTAVPTVSAIVSTGAKPVFIDIDPETYTMDPERLETCLKNQQLPMKAKAVIPVHLYGHPADMKPILETAGHYGLKVIEDACQAHGSEYYGVKIGTLGDAGCFSFYPTKNLGGYGDGGMVLVNDKSMADHLQMLRNYGEEKKYQNMIHGYNSRLDELQAAILRVKLRHLDEWILRRRSIAGLYNDLLSDTEISIPCEASYARHVYHLYIVRSKERVSLQQRLKKNGVFTGIHYPAPIHYQKAYQGLGYLKGDFPISEKFASEILSLPMYPELESEHIEYICQIIREDKNKGF